MYMDEHDDHSKIMVCERKKSLNEMVDLFTGERMNIPQKLNSNKIVCAENTTWIIKF